MDLDKALDIRESFDRFDKDGNGMIDLIEFRDLLEAIGADLGRAEAEAVFDTIDTVAGQIGASKNLHHRLITLPLEQQSIVRRRLQTYGIE